MKTVTITRLLTSTLAMSVLLLSSCSKNNQQAFSKRKYMPYFVKHHVKHDHKADPQTIGYEDRQHASETAVVQEMQTVKAEQHRSLATGVTEPVIEARSIQRPTPQELALPKSNISREKAQVGEIAETTKIAAEPGLVTELPKVKRRDLIREIKEYSDADGIALILLVIIAILLPPVAVLLVDGLSLSFLLGLLLWLLFYIPGLIYALYVIFRAY